VLKFEVAVRLPRSDRTYVRLDDNKLNVDILADLFSDPRRVGNKIELLVTLLVENTSENRTSLEERVEQAHSSATKDWNIYRIGDYVDHPQSNQALNLSFPAIPVQWPFLAWSGFDEPDAYAFYTPSAYDFGNYCIGDHFVKDGFYEVPVLTGHRYRGPCAGESYAKMQAAVKTFADTPSHQRHQIPNGTPILPPYCFSQYNSQIYRLGMTAQEWPQGERIHLAVRCVGHIDMPTVAEHYDIPFSKNIRFSLAHTANAGDVRACVITALRVPDAAIHWDPQELFNGARNGNREIERPMLPQAQSEVKLFRYASTTGAVGQDLKRSMNKDLVTSQQQPDHRLYMEAHILPKQNQDNIRGNRLTTGTEYEVDDDVTDDGQQLEQDQASAGEQGKAHNKPRAAQPAGSASRRGH